MWCIVRMFCLSLVGKMGIEEEKKLKAKARTSMWKNAKSQVARGMTVDKVESLQEAFVQIQEQTGIKDLDEMVSVIIQGSFRPPFELFWT